MLLALVSLAVLLSGRLDPDPPKIAPTTLSNLANYADVVVVGRVASVVCIGPDGITAAVAHDGEAARCSAGRAVAEVEVERVLRGDPRARRVWYLAESRGGCDVSQAIPNERGLFFLTQSEPVFEDDLAAELARVQTSDQPVLYDAYYGRGRMPLRMIEGEEWLTAWDDVEAPADLAVRDAAWDGEYASIYWSARLDAVCRFVEGALRTRENPLPAHPVSGVPARVAVFGDGGQVVAALWADGTAVWSEDPQNGGPPFREGGVAADATYDIAQWCRERELDREPPSLGAVAERITIRSGLQFYDLALDPKTKPARRLRDRVMQALPESGVPLAAGSLEVR